MHARRAKTRRLVYDNDQSVGDQCGENRSGEVGMNAKPHFLLHLPYIYGLGGHAPTSSSPVSISFAEPILLSSETPMAPSATPDRMNLTMRETRDIIFDVEGYEAAKQLACDGGCFQSDKFTVGGHDWAVRYYPNVHSSYVSVTLVLLSKPKDACQLVGARFACTLRDKHGHRSPERRRAERVVRVLAVLRVREGFLEVRDARRFGGP
ncbi:hypothetical protein ACP70R_037610 [Stipagrostis hirtigluma subsp. patula]